MWTLNGDRARLTGDPFCATIPLKRPAEGIQEVQFGQQTISFDKLLAISSSQTTDDTIQLLDCYVRGHDLVANYDEVKPDSLRSQVYWRALQSEKRTVGIELIVSTQTSLLDSNPGIRITSECAASETLHLRADSTSQFQACEECSQMNPGTSKGLVLIRLASCDKSLVQMVHPRDFVFAEVVTADPPRSSSVIYSLFAERLEKGVIRCGRLRCVLVPRVDDEQSALDCFSQFSESAPPLTV